MHLRNDDLIRYDRNLVIEELLAILLWLQSLDVRRLDAVDNATALCDCVALALHWVDREEVLGEVCAHDNFLSEDLLEALEVVFMVLKGDFFEHCLHNLNLFVLLKYIYGKVDRLDPAFCETDNRVFSYLLIRPLLVLSIVAALVHSPVLR